MLAKSKKSFALQLLALLLSFLYLQLLLLSTFLSPTIEIDEQWVPQSFFFSAKLSTCIIRVPYDPRAIFESMFFSIVALVGYYHANSIVTTMGMDSSRLALANFGTSMMGVRQKYYWMCYVPWIITFLQNWLQNIGEFVMLLGGQALYEASDFMPAIIILLLYFCVQAMLASEVVCMALQGWYAMHNINRENVLLEQRERMLLGVRLKM